MINLRLDDQSKTQYMQVVSQTHEQKVEMYLKLEKLQLIEMLIECNRIIDARGPVVLNPTITQDYTTSVMLLTK